MNYVVPIAIVLTLFRVYLGATVEPESMTWLDAYKDVAHFYMGYLLALAIQNKKWWPLFWGMTVLEVTVAVLSRAM